MNSQYFIPETMEEYRDKIKRILCKKLLEDVINCSKFNNKYDCLNKLHHYLEFCKKDVNENFIQNYNN